MASKLISKTKFLKKYNIKDVDFAATHLSWEDLGAIYEDYNSIIDNLESVASMLASKLLKTDKVHLIRYRVKDAEHVIAKIIRKKIDPETADRNYTIDNYRSQLTDLIGLRAIHLFKQDWVHIHKNITESWKVTEDIDDPIVAFYREGDDPAMNEIYSEHGCKIKVHKRGYRSVHYIVETQPFMDKIYVEIQVRTIFEEGWGEIDHKIKYPFHNDDKIYANFLLILNRLAGSADEMGSFILMLSQHFESERIKFDTLQEEMQEKIDEKLKEENEQKKQAIESLKSKYDGKTTIPKDEVFEELDKIYNPHKSWEALMKMFNPNQGSKYRGPRQQALEAILGYNYIPSIAELLAGTRPSGDSKSEPGEPNQE